MKHYAVSVFQDEAKAILKLIDLLDENFEKVVHSILNTSGRVIVTGIGKSGTIGNKIATTLASTGTPSFFLHPAEAFHGDLGMIKKEDVILAITNSGETDEILKLIPFFKVNGNLLISITGNPNSTLAKNSSFHLNIHVDKEVCPLDLAPTTSATTTLVMGDALVVALMNERNFQPEDYATFHPGGNLGRRLLLKVEDVMRSEYLPIVSSKMKISEVLTEISKARLGLVIVTECDKLIGIVTDGDLRRAIQKYNKDVFDLSVESILNTAPLSVYADESIINAEIIIRENNIHTLLVLNKMSKIVGVLESYKCIIK